jgi:hypothetical protein
MEPGYFQRLHQRQALHLASGGMKIQNVQTRAMRGAVEVKCLLLQQQASGDRCWCPNRGANAANKHKAAASLREPCEGALEATCTGWWQGSTGAVYRRNDS